MKEDIKKRNGREQLLSIMVEVEQLRQTGLRTSEIYRKLKDKIETSKSQFYRNVKALERGTAVNGHQSPGGKLEREPIQSKPSEAKKVVHSATPDLSKLI